MKANSMATADVYSHIKVQTTLKSRHGIKTFDYPQAQCMIDSGFLVVTTLDGFHRVFNLKEVDCWLKKPRDHANGDASA
jgi:hypothetical protein